MERKLRALPWEVWILALAGVVEWRPIGIQKSAEAIVVAAHPRRRAEQQQITSALSSTGVEQQKTS